MSNLEKVRSLLDAFEKFQVDAFLDAITDDATYQFGNYPAAHGKEAIAATIQASHLDRIKGIKFNIINMWEVGDAVIAELTIDYIKVDDSVLTLPCLDVFRMAGDRVKSMQVYMDATPLFA